MFVKNCFYFNILKSFMIYGEARCEAIKGWKKILTALSEQLQMKLLNFCKVCSSTLYFFLGIINFVANKSCVTKAKT